MGAVNFCQRSEYSFFGSLLRLQELIYCTALQGFEACCLTDTLSTFGYYQLSKWCEEYKIKPIYGLEIFVNGVSGRGCYPILIIAENNIGLSNIFRLNTLSYQRFDKEMSFTLSLEVLHAHREGLFVITEQEALLHHDNYSYLTHYFEKMSSLFGDHYYFSLNYTGPAKVSFIKEMIALTSHYDIPVLANAECRHQPNDRDKFLSLNQLREKHFKQDERGLRLDQNMDFSMRGKIEFEHLFSRHPEILQNNIDLLEKITAHLDLRHYHYSTLSIPLSTTESISDQSEGQLPENSGWYNNLNLLKQLYAFIEKEHIPFFPYHASLIPFQVLQGWLHQLHEDSFPLLKYSAFLVTHLGMDVGFESKDRLIQYIISLFGNQQVAYCASVSHLPVRTAIRDLAGLNNLPHELYQELLKTIPSHQYRNSPRLETLIRKKVTLQHLMSVHPEIKILVDTAAQLEGLPSYSTVHSNTIFIIPQGIEKFATLEYFKEGQYLAQIQRSDLYGHIPHLDISADRITSLLHECHKMLEHEVAFDDLETWKNINGSLPSALLPYDPPRLSQLIRTIDPQNLDSLADVITIYQTNLKKEKSDLYFSSKTSIRKGDIAGLIQITSGKSPVILYQEELLSLMQVASNLDISTVTQVWELLQTQQADQIAQARGIFLQKSENNPERQDTALGILSLTIENQKQAVQYSEMLSESIRYYLISYFQRTQPLVLYSTALNLYQGYPVRLNDMLSEIRQKEIKILPIEINESDIYCRQEKDSIRMGLIFVKHLSLKKCQDIIHERSVGGHYKDLRDFLMRIRKSGLSPRQNENLIKSGAFRKEWSSIISALDIAANFQKWMDQNPSLLNLNVEENDLFTLNSLFELPEYAELHSPEFKESAELRDIQNMEYILEATDLYLDQHPVERYQEELRHLQIDHISRIEQLHYAVFAVYLYHINVIQTKDGRDMAFARISDPTGISEAVLFPRIYQRFLHVIRNQELYLVKGTIDDQKLIVEEIYLLKAVL